MPEKNNEYENYTAQPEGRLFSSAMFGFNKEEVLEYLEELADENQSQQDTIEKQIQELNSKITSLEQQLAAADQQKLADAEALKTENQNLQALLHSNSQKQQELQQAIDIAKAANEQAEEDLVKQRDDLEAAVKEAAWLRNEYQASDAKIAQLQRQLEAAAANNNTEAAAKIADLEKRLAAANMERDELRTLAERPDPNDALQRELEQAQDELFALRQQLLEQPNTTASAELEEQAQHEIAMLKAEIEELKAAEETLLETQTELAAVKEQLAKAQQNSTEINSLHEHIAKLVNENKGLKEAQATQEAAAKHEIESLQNALTAAQDEAVDDELQQQIDKLIADNDTLREQNSELGSKLQEYKDYYEEWSEEDERRDVAERGVRAIIAEANEEAAKIRNEAIKEKDRLQRQIRNSAGGLSESITNLREDLSGVEGDVSEVLEAVQKALADILNALSRTETNLNTLDTQVERFPATAPAVPKQQVVYFQPSKQQLVSPNDGAPNKSLGSANFKRLDAAAEQAAAPILAEATQEDKLRGLSETLVDTLRQMLN